MRTRTNLLFIYVQNIIQLLLRAYAINQKSSEMNKRARAFEKLKRVAAIYQRVQPSLQRLYSTKSTQYKWRVNVGWQQGVDDPCSILYTFFFILKYPNAIDPSTCLVLHINNYFTLLFCRKNK